MLLLLTGCATAQPVLDPIAMQSTANALNLQASGLSEQASISAQRTQVARNEIAFVAEVTAQAIALQNTAVASNATQTQTAIELADNQSKATQTEQSAKWTQNAIEAKSVQEAQLKELNLRASQMAFEVRQTQAAKVEEMQIAKTEALISIINAIPACLTVLAGLFGLVGGYALYRKLTAPINWQEWHNRYASLPDGTMIMDDDGQWRFLPKPGITPQLEAPKFRYTVMGKEKPVIDMNDPILEPEKFSVAEELPVDEIERNKKLIAFIIACQHYQANDGDGLGWNSNQIPRWDKLKNYNSDSWKIITNELQRRGMIKKIQPGTTGEKNGTFVLAPYNTLHGVFTALRKGESPAPQRGFAYTNYSGTGMHIVAQESTGESTENDEEN